MCPDPAPSAAEIAIGTNPAPPPELRLFFPEPGEDRIRAIRPELTERPVPDVPDKKFRRAGELAGVYVPLCIDICHTGTSTAPAF